MLNLNPPEVNKKFANDKQNLDDIRNYLWQLYREIDFRLEELAKENRSLKEKLERMEET